MKKRAALLLAFVVVISAFWPGVGAGATQGGHKIVVLREGERAPEFAREFGVRPSVVYTKTIRGFAADLTAEQVVALEADPRVAYVEDDAPVSLVDVGSWGLDRVDQRDLPLDNTYTYTETGAGVSAYIIDTGIRITHTDFGGRAVYGTDTSCGTPPCGTLPDDDHGHGTHVAGTVGGATYGVAKNVRLVAVKVLDGGSGFWSWVIAGIDWVTADHLARGTPAVANMSLGGPYNQAVNDATEASIAAGVNYGIAAGNSAADACNFSPSSTPSANTAAASDITDHQAGFSNWGACVDLYAPGVNITSDWNTSDTATNTISGTSMAAPHVTGTAALVLELSPTATPAQVSAVIEAGASVDKIVNATPGTPNLLDYTLLGSTPPPPPPPITLTATKMRVKGWHVVELDWQPFDATRVANVYRNEQLVITTIDDGFYVDIPGTKGSALHTYQVCIPLTGECSNTVSVQYGNRTHVLSCETAPHGCFKVRPVR